LKTLNNDVILLPPVGVCETKCDNPSARQACLNQPDFLEVLQPSNSRDLPDLPGAVLQKVMMVAAMHLQTGFDVEKKPQTRLMAEDSR
jgi:hypothetical protein